MHLLTRTHKSIPSPRLSPLLLSSALPSHLILSLPQIRLARFAKNPQALNSKTAASFPQGLKYNTHITHCCFSRNVGMLLRASAYDWLHFAPSTLIQQNVKENVSCTGLLDSHALEDAKDGSWLVAAPHWCVCVPCHTFGFSNFMAFLKELSEWVQQPRATERDRSESEITECQWLFYRRNRRLTFYQSTPCAFWVVFTCSLKSKLIFSRLSVESRVAGVHSSFRRTCFVILWTRVKGFKKFTCYSSSSVKNRGVKKKTEI